MEEEKEAVTIKVEDSKSKKNGDKKKGEKDKLDEDELTPEDAALKEGLELAVTRTRDSDLGIVGNALEHLRKEIRSATTSMTSVPKPLKFLRPHYGELKSVYEAMPDAPQKRDLADILSVLAMTMASDARESLAFKLKGNPADLGSWGHEYVRSLTGEIGAEYNARVLAEAEEGGGEEEKKEEDEGKMQVEGATNEDLISLVKVILPFHLEHHAEAEAVDLLVEVQQLPLLVALQQQGAAAAAAAKQTQTPPEATTAEAGAAAKGVVDENNYQRICLYLLRTADFMADPEDLTEILHTAYSLYTHQGAAVDALRVALKLHDAAKVGDTMRAAAASEKAAAAAANEAEEAAKGGKGDEAAAAVAAAAAAADAKSVRQQMALVLARHRFSYEEEDEDDLNELVGNGKLSGLFLALARDVDVMEPKTPEDIYKSHLADTAAFVRRRDANRTVDSASANLANTFVNGFVNAGFGSDKLMTPEDTQWLYKNKEHGMLSAAASLGLLFLWDVDEGLVALDKYLYTKEDYIKAGAVLAIGVVSSGIKNESDPPIALLPEHIAEDSPTIVRQTAAAAFGIAYAGSAREDVMEYLLPAVTGGDEDGAAAPDMGLACLAALSLGQVFVGTCSDEVGGCLVEKLMEASDEDLDHPLARFLCLGLGLLFFGRMEKADGMVEAVKTVEHPMGRLAEVVLTSCAYCGTGNVLQVQGLLGRCAEHLTEAKGAEQQAAAVLGIAMVSLGEDVGAGMAGRALDHLLQYCELPIKRAVPLALALLHVSNPDYAAVDQMGRLSHDNDPEVAMAAVMGLGIIGAGTNNSRVAGLLRQLAEHGRDRDHTFVVRLAQGLLHMGKGLVGLNPHHSDRLLLSGVGMGGLLTVLHACLDLKRTLLDKVHYLMYYLTGSMNPRMVMTVEADSLEPLPVTVRVGQAVEVVGQAGKPKSISGFQTHTTPVPLAVTERAELAGEEWLVTGSCLEGIVILKKNPDYEPEAV